MTMTTSALPRRHRLSPRLLASRKTTEYQSLLQHREQPITWGQTKYLNWRLYLVLEVDEVLHHCLLVGPRSDVILHHVLLLGQVAVKLEVLVRAWHLRPPVKETAAFVTKCSIAGHVDGPKVNRKSTNFLKSLAFSSLSNSIVISTSPMITLLPQRHTSDLPFKTISFCGDLFFLRIKYSRSATFLRKNG